MGEKDVENSRQAEGLSLSLGEHVSTSAPGKC